jgi:hypothetical protein
MLCNVAEGVQTFFQMHCVGESTPTASSPAPRVNLQYITAVGCCVAEGGGRQRWPGHREMLNQENMTSPGRAWISSAVAVIVVKASGLRLLTESDEEKGNTELEYTALQNRGWG